MTVETIERKLWTCNACGDEEITTGDKPKDWVMLWAWATRYVVRDLPDRPKILDIAVHTCHECSSGPMYFIVRNLIKHLTDDAARGFKGERCETLGCVLPNKHKGNHKIPHARAALTSESIVVHKIDAKPPPLHGPDDDEPPKPCPIADCVMPEHEGVIHMNDDSDEFEYPEVDKDGKPYDEYPGVLSTDSDGDPLEVQNDHPDSCTAQKGVAATNFSGSDVVHCHKHRDHDGQHHDAHYDVKWPTKKGE